ncbi:F5/8 type C domain-containing protein [Pseudoduganella flava]|uniref:Coagulation factor 5/8 type domain-containing protein n=1 Tax=Pseudoduganella flava TaxID=871742 RepID=A0A562Q687_9BURK|nr:discoidin domain-containing protein [Pseudoduganella flava]QGZ41704.1 coagulation factor 5/8 type domain-containing protein [Pseudoduganella flava]TWI51700.1 F5/8 type C domain-containing protein [Pseudoduganella flava]
MKRWIATLLAVPLFASAQTVLDGFETLDAWQAQASDGVAARASAAPGWQGQALRLDVDFGDKGGYAFARRTLPLDLPDNYEIAFMVKGDLPSNHLEFKLTDASGDNVWWHRLPDYPFANDWKLVRFKKRQVAFAWGPTKDRTLRHADRIEFVVSAGSGGKGSVWIDELTLRALPPVPATWPALRAEASSGQATMAVDGRADTAWQSTPGDKRQDVTVDLGAVREFGGLVLRWLPGRHASRYDVALSMDGRTWQTVRSVRNGNGGSDALLLTESEARYIRLLLQDGPAESYALAEVELKELAFGATPNDFIRALAVEAPQGAFPRGFSGQQPYWTLVGIDGGARHSALIGEDGALEPARGGYAVEPFVLADGRLSGWADVEVTQSLRDDYLPIPSVHWRAPGWTLTTTASAAGTPDASQLLARYTLRNLKDVPQTLELVLAARPFQVNAPRQFLNTPGGYSPIRDMRWDGRALHVEGRPPLIPLRAPDAVQLSTFDAGLLPFEGGSAAAAVHDDTGFASGALRWKVTLPPQGSTVIGAVMPLTGAFAAPADGLAWLERTEAQVAETWRAKLSQVTLTVPPAGKRMADTVRSSLAHILMTRDGAAIQPGTRSYLRSWIRDGAMMSEALLRMGMPDVAADYLRWYAPYQFDNGKVPCCVDARGADPVPENDSHGEFIFLASELYRYTGDKAALQAVWPRVAAAARYMESLRQSERTPAQRGTPLFGLMPASISHEGYSEKPMHSYWDDFWALRGYKDAVTIAQALGRRAEARKLARQRDAFRRDLYASLDAATHRHGIGYLPGAAELGDFDPTSTTIALTPGGEQQHLPRALVEETYRKYWDFFTARRDGTKAWDDYTPYELRNVSAFVRLGWRDKAEQLLAYFYADQRPRAWNQWAEVVGRDARTPRFLGDMPHGWIASDFLRAALDSFAYEREPDHALLLAEGIPLAWLIGDGIAIRGLRTPYGQLGYRLRRTGGQMTLDVAAGLTIPPGGIVLRWPYGGPPGAARLNGRPVRWRDGAITIRALPATLYIDIPDEVTRP